MKKTIFFIGLFVLSLFTVKAQTMFQSRHYNSHFMFQSSLSFNAGVGELNFGGRHLLNKIPNYCIDQVIAYEFNPYVNLGVDFGVNIWRKTAFIPVALHLTVTFMDYKVAPMWYMNAGYSFKWYVSSKPEKMTRVVYGAKPGPYLNTGLGVKLQLSEKVSLIFAADYKMQYSTIQYYERENEIEYDYSMVATNRTQNMFYHFVGMKVGVLYW